MDDKCKNCTEKCPQADMAHQAAMGRMYATNEFINLQKKIDSGELVEVVYCKDCTRCKKGYCTIRKDSWGAALLVGEHDFCSDGERKDK